MNEKLEIIKEINAREYLNAKEVGIYLGLSKQIIAKLVKIKGFPVLFLERRNLVKKSELDKWFNNNKGKYIL